MFARACASVKAHRQPRKVSLLQPEGADETVEDCGDEDYGGGDVVQVVQAILES